MDTTGEIARPRSRDYPLLSADCHISAPHDLYAQLPQELQAVAPSFEQRGDVMWFLSPGLPDYPSLPKKLDGIWDPATTRMMLEREYRLTWGQAAESQQSQRARIEDQLRDGVEAEVLYHNAAGNIPASPSLQYQVAVCRLLNDWLSGWVRDFEHRMVATAALPLYLDQIDVTIAEMERARKLGFRSATLPVVVPWLPYDHACYERLWSAFEDLDMVAGFHVFSGNAYTGTDFADVLSVPPELLKEGRALMDRKVFTERLSLTVMGMAAGMSPVVHLCGSGILERHPRLRFVIVEAEMGWLGWVLQSMDAMAQAQGSLAQPAPLAAAKRVLPAPGLDHLH